MFDSPLSSSAYEILAVAWDADDETLRRAYRVRLRQTHPDTGGDAAQFVLVQRAWELVGTPDARAPTTAGTGLARRLGSRPRPRLVRPAARLADTRPRARAAPGHPAAAPRALPDAHARVGRARRDARRPVRPGARVVGAARGQVLAFADALAEEATARIVADLGMGYTAARHRRRPPRPRREGRPRRARPERPVRRAVGGLRRARAHAPGGELVPPTPSPGRRWPTSSHARAVARGACAVWRGARRAARRRRARAHRGARQSQGLPVAVGRGPRLDAVRRGVTGAREIGGNELYDAHAPAAHRPLRVSRPPCAGHPTPTPTHCFVPSHSVRAVVRVEAEAVSRRELTRAGGEAAERREGDRRWLG